MDSSIFWLSRIGAANAPAKGECITQGTEVVFHAGRPSECHSQSSSGRQFFCGLQAGQSPSQAFRRPSGSSMMAQASSVESNLVAKENISFYLCCVGLVLTYHLVPEGWRSTTRVDFSLYTSEPRCQAHTGFYPPNPTIGRLCASNVQVSGGFIAL